MVNAIIHTICFFCMLPVLIMAGFVGAVNTSIPVGYPKGVEKIKLGYFQDLNVSGIYGDLIKLNDGRVLIYRATGTQTYLFDPKDDSFRRTAITDAPFFYGDNAIWYKEKYNHTELGVTLNNGKVLILPYENFREEDEMSYYNYYFDSYTPERILVTAYFDNKTEENRDKAINYIKENCPDAYNAFKKRKAYEENAKHAHLYNPETEKMETIDIPPFVDRGYTYKLLLKNGNVLLINGSAAAIYNPETNKFTLLPKNNKIVGHDRYAVLSDGTIFMMDSQKERTPYLYDINTDTLTKKDSKIFNGVVLSNRYVQFKDDSLCFLHKTKDSDVLSVFCYNPHTEDSILTPLINSSFGQVVQKLNDGSLLLTGKYYTQPFLFRIESKDRPDYHVQWAESSSQKTKMLTKKTHYTHSKEYSQAVLLDDGRILFRNTDYTNDGYELFIPYSYAKQKKEEQKRLNQEAKKK